MAAYRYILSDLLSNAVLTELPLKRVRFDSHLNGVGSLIGDLKLSDVAVQKLNPWGLTLGGRTALYVDRGGRILWGGIVVPRRYSEGQSAPGGVGVMSMQVAASEIFWYFLNKSVIATDLTYTASDQLAIAQALINYQQAKPGGNIGLQVPGNTSGVQRTQIWKGSDRKKVGEALIDLSQLDNGFDWRVDIGYGVGGQAAGVIGKQLLLGYPRLGNPFTTSGWMFEYPGNVVDYSWSEDSSLQAVTAYVQGTGVGGNMVQSSSTVTSLLDAGNPLLEEVFRAKDQADASVIAARAVSAAKTYSSPVTLIQLVVRADLDPVLGSYAVGDDVNLRITSQQFPAVGGSVGYDVFWRIVAITVQPQDDNQPERVYLTLGAIPS